jgi:CRISPR-associated protein Cas2
VSSNKIHRYLLTYDVVVDTRRTRVAKTLESYGDRLQYSVFLVDIKPAKMIRLKTAMTAHLDPVTDSLLVCDLGPLDGEGGRRIEYVGVKHRFTGHGPLVL